MNLTPKQRYALERLVVLQQQRGFARWTTMDIGPSGARALRSLDGTGLVKINTSQSNMYFYSITDAGRAAIAAEGANHG